MPETMLFSSFSISVSWPNQCRDQQAASQPGSSPPSGRIGGVDEPFWASLSASLQTLCFFRQKHQIIHIIRLISALAQFICLDQSVESETEPRNGRNIEIPPSVLVNYTEYESLLLCVCCLFFFFHPFLVYVLSLLHQLATWDSTRGLNGSLKENRIESSMQGVTLRIVTLLVSCGSLLNLLILDLSRQKSENNTANSLQPNSCKGQSSDRMRVWFV